MLLNDTVIFCLHCFVIVLPCYYQLYTRLPDTFISHGFQQETQAFVFPYKTKEENIFLIGIQLQFFTCVLLAYSFIITIVNRVRGKENRLVCKCFYVLQYVPAHGNKCI